MPGCVTLASGILCLRDNLLNECTPVTRELLLVVICQFQLTLFSTWQKYLFCGLNQKPLIVRKQSTVEKKIKCLVG